MSYKKWFKSTIFFLILFLWSGVAYSDHNKCHYCGMIRTQYGHSWIILEHEGGSVKGVCSIHCASIDMVIHSRKLIRSITVGDYYTQKQIDANKAFWVIGGNKAGVMTSRAKWAFETKEAVDDFMRRHGGKSALFSDVLKASFEDMYEDILMIQKKRIMMKISKD
ncbi:MAG: NosL family protein [Desulfobacula sp.]|nr:NosL family protein [Desulfobacula sp.]